MFSKILKFFKNIDYGLFELSVLLYIMAFSLSHMSDKMLMQDKVCLVSFNKSKSFCAQIHLHSNQTNIQNEKNQILATAVTYNSYL